ncbi:MAG: arsenate reductase (glutaredoxin) [Rhodobacteraceae bacterium]|nr:MAG: arsenate reductase (glutaredoxin) [Paracoccaceae bacterium]
MTVVIFHNPRCSKSRETLDLIREAGEDPVVVPYLEAGWNKPQLQALFAVAGIAARDALRGGAPAKDLGLLDEGVGEDAILEAMVAHPELVERPLVCSPKGVKICRPPELVNALL